MTPLHTSFCIRADITLVIDAGAVSSLCRSSGSDCTPLFGLSTPIDLGVLSREIVSFDTVQLLCSTDNSLAWPDAAQYTARRHHRLAIDGYEICHASISAKSWLRSLVNAPPEHAVGSVD